MGKVVMTRLMAENALISKHTLRILPFVDSGKEEHIEEIAGNELRALKRYPVGYDFIANIIEQARKNGIGDYITDVDENYFKTVILDSVFCGYFANCGGFAIRQSLKRQLLLDLNKGVTVIYGQDKKMGKFISQRRPFIITAKTDFETGEEIIEILFSKAVFGSLVDETVFKTGGDGYIEIPCNFYPYLTQANIGDLGSHNPIYKANIFGLLKNTHKVDNIKVPKNEFIENVCPEYFKMKNDGYYHFDREKYNINSFNGSMYNALEEVQRLFPNELLLCLFFERNGFIELFFENIKENKEKSEQYKREEFKRNVGRGLIGETCKHKLNENVELIDRLRSRYSDPVKRQ